jgi:hypothetical protein
LNKSVSDRGTDPQSLYIAEKTEVDIVEEDFETPELADSDEGHTERRLGGEEVVITLR